MTDIDRLMAEAERQQAEIRSQMAHKPPQKPAAALTTDNLDSNGWEVAQAALKARDAFKTQLAASVRREAELRDDLSRLRDTVTALTADLDDERHITDALTRSLKRLARKAS